MFSAVYESISRSCSQSEMETPRTYNSEVENKTVELNREECDAVGGNGLRLSGGGGRMEKKQKKATPLNIKHLEMNEYVLVVLVFEQSRGRKKFMDSCHEHEDMSHYKCKTFLICYTMEKREARRGKFEWKFS